MIVVEASAGTGKTHTLVTEISEGIKAGRYELATTAAITFTRKAAAELSSRLRARLPETEGLYVGTIHSFCARILRAYPTESGISPGFRELEEHDDELLCRRVLRAAWEELDGRQLIRSLAEFDATAADVWPALKVMLEQGEVPHPCTKLPLPDPAEVWRDIEAFCDFLRGSLPQTHEREPTCKILAAGQAFCEKVSQSAGNRWRDVYRLLCLWENEPTPIKRYWGTKRAEQNVRLAPVQERIETFRKGVALPTLFLCRTHLYGELIPFLSRVRSSCQQQRRRLGLLNFNDMLQLCAALLEGHSEVRSRLKDKIRHLFVDEFQDTDPLQARVFAALEPKTLFIVGDPKQSIYRFRRADVQTYLGFRKRADQLRTLEISYRSGRALCDWNNRVFRQLLPEQPTELQAGFAVLRPLEGSKQGGVFKLTLDSERYQDVAKDEAERVAACIADRVRSKRTHGWGDFLILTARRAEVRLYQQALEKLQIPNDAACEEAELGYRASSFLPLLRYLADPQDNITLVGVLRGPLFGHSDDELYRHVQAAGTMRPYPPGPGLREVVASLEKLDAWRNTTRFMPLGAAGWWLLQKTGLASLAASEGPSSMAELRGMVDFLRNCGERGLTMPQAVAELVERRRIDQPSAFLGQPDAVRVMNVHKAKGLEARVVFLAAPTSGFSLTTDQVVTPEREGYLCLRRYRKPFAQPDQWERLQGRELNYLQAEHRRFLYVATTRARETLVVGRWSGRHGSANLPWGELEPFLTDCPELEVPAAPDVSGPAPVVTEASVYEAMLAARDTRRIPSWVRGTAALGNHRLKPTLPAGPVELDAAAWGKLVHRLLEAVIRKPSLDSSGLERAGRWFCFEDAELLQALPYALETVERARQTELWKWVMDAEQRLVEIPFGVKHGKRVLFGTIDLALQRNQDWGLIDHKTDRQKLEVLVQTYAAQLEQYVKSWNAVVEEPLRYAGVFGVREGRLSPDLRPPS